MLGMWGSYQCQWQGNGNFKWYNWTEGVISPGRVLYYSSPITPLVCFERGNGRRRVSVLSLPAPSLERLIFPDGTCLRMSYLLTSQNFTFFPATCLPFWVCHPAPLLPQQLATGPGWVFQGTSSQTTVAWFKQREEQYGTGWGRAETMLPCKRLPCWMTGGGVGWGVSVHS